MTKKFDLKLQKIDDEGGAGGWRQIRGFAARMPLPKEAD